MTDEEKQKVIQCFLVQSYDNAYAYVNDPDFEVQTDFHFSDEVIAHLAIEEIKRLKGIK